MAEVFRGLDSFEMIPKKTFFGLDKGKSYCFTLPKQLTEQIKFHFNLDKSLLQKGAKVEIRGRQFPILIRLIRLDRSKPVKHADIAFPKREVVQFSWKSHDETQWAINSEFHLSYSEISKNGENTIEKALFVHKKDEIFILEKQSLFGF